MKMSKKNRNNVEHLYASEEFDAETLAQIEENHQVVFRYRDNPNGSVHDIAGVTNAAGNVVGLMPHPEHSVEMLTGGSVDGLTFFASVQKFLAAQSA